MPDDMAAVLAEIRARNEHRITAMRYTAWTVEHHVAEGDVRRLLAALEAALSHHQQTPLYGRASAEDKPDACPHDPDDALHFEADSGGWLCEGRPDGAVCLSCTEDGEPVDWPCPEYAAVLAALAGRGGDVNEAELPTRQEIKDRALSHLRNARNEMSEVRDWLNSDWRPLGAPLSDAQADARRAVLKITADVKRLIDQAKGILQGEGDDG